MAQRGLGYAFILINDSGYGYQTEAQQPARTAFQAKQPDFRSLRRVMATKRRTHASLTHSESFRTFEQGVSCLLNEPTKQAYGDRKYNKGNRQS